jgi:hypothetical protein
MGNAPVGADFQGANATRMARSDKKEVILQEVEAVHPHDDQHVPIAEVEQHVIRTLAPQSAQVCPSCPGP